MHTTTYTAQHAPITKDVELVRHEPIKLRFRTLRNVIGMLIICWCALALFFICLALVYCLITGRDLPFYGAFTMVVRYIIMAVSGLISMPKFLDVLNADSRARGEKETFDKGYYDRAAWFGYIGSGLMAAWLLM